MNDTKLNNDFVEHDHYQYGPGFYCTPDVIDRLKTERDTMCARIAELEAAAVPVQAIPEPTPMVYNCCGREVCDTANCPNSGPYSKVPKWRMAAYYYGFEATGVAAIDKILSAIACAGKCFHDTSQWVEAVGKSYEYHTGDCPVDWIQNAANQAAAMLSAAPTPPSQSPVVRNGFVRANPDDPYTPAGAPYEAWNTPFYDLQTRLEICAGAVAYEQKVSANQRRQKEELQAKLEAANNQAAGSCECAAPIPQAEPPQPSHQQLMANLHAYEEIAEHYAKCAISPEALPTAPETPKEAIVAAKSLPVISLVTSATG